MKLFDVKYLHDSVVNDVTVGSNVFCADTLKDIIQYVNGNKPRAKLTHMRASSNPFEVGAGLWRYIYYDPNYDAKFAFSKGKPIEYHNTIDGVWYPWDLDEEPDDWDEFQWRAAEAPKPQTDFKLGDVVRLLTSDRNRTYLITGVDNENDEYRVHGNWHKASELQLVDDSPLGWSNMKGEVTAREDDKENE